MWIKLTVTVFILLRSTSFTYFKLGCLLQIYCSLILLSTFHIPLASLRIIYICLVLVSLIFPFFYHWYLWKVSSKTICKTSPTYHIVTQIHFNFLPGSWNIEGIERKVYLNYFVNFLATICENGTHSYNNCLLVLKGISI